MSLKSQIRPVTEMQWLLPVSTNQFQVLAPFVQKQESLWPE